MADEAFHEIQLNGKQLVFLFMAATVVAVVIFLCGVMVGRGVRAPRPGELADLSVEAAADPTADIQASPRNHDSVPPASGISVAAPATMPEKLSYPERLAEPTSPPETLSEPPAAAPAPAPKARDARGAANAPAPAREGFTVQVAAVKERGEADTIARRLTTRGYPAYVMSPVSGAPRVFRVRVGKFRDRREAELTADRLEKEEQFKPWVTR